MPSEVVRVFRLASCSRDGSSSSPSPYPRYHVRRIQQTSVGRPTHGRSICEAREPPELNRGHLEHVPLLQGNQLIPCDAVQDPNDIDCTFIDQQLDVIR
jgi:hypothetical protein